MGRRTSEHDVKVCFAWAGLPKYAVRCVGAFVRATGLECVVMGFRVVQHRDLSVTVEYVPSGDDAPILKVLSEFERTLNTGVPMEFRRVASIPHDRGKLKFVVRELT